MGERKTVFMFPAAGAQKPGAAEFLKEYGKDPFGEADKFLPDPISTICAQGPVKLLNQAHITNTAVFAQSAATDQLLKERGIKPDYVVGFSLGEYSALHASGCIGFEEGIKFLYETSKQYQEAFPSDEYGMALVAGTNLELKELESACESITLSGNPLYVANINAPGRYVVAGVSKVFNQLQEMIQGSGLVTPSRVHVPSHTPLVAKLQKELMPYVKTLIKGSYYPVIPVLSIVSGELVQDHHDLDHNLSCHITAQVNWINAVKKLREYGVNTFVEVGPGHALCNLTPKNCIGQPIETYHTENKESLDATLSALGKDL